MGSIQLAEFTTLADLNDWLNNQEASNIRIITPVFNTSTNVINYVVEYHTELATGTP